MNVKTEGCSVLYAVLPSALYMACGFISQRGIQTTRHLTWQCVAQYVTQSSRDCRNWIVTSMAATWPATKLQTSFHRMTMKNWVVMRQRSWLVAKVVRHYLQPVLRTCWYRWISPVASLHLLLRSQPNRSLFGERRRHLPLAVRVIEVFHAQRHLIYTWWICTMKRNMPYHARLAICTLSHANNAMNIWCRATMVHRLCRSFSDHLKRVILVLVESPERSFCWSLVWRLFLLLMMAWMMTFHRN